MTSVTRTHEATVQSFYETANSTSRRKRKRVTVPEPAEEPPAIRAVKANLETVQLKSWPLTLNAALFVRPPKQSDHNTLLATKHLGNTSEYSSEPHALIFITVYNPLSWGHKLIARSSQHVLLSSQTIGDFFDSIPCVSNELPQRTVDEDAKINWAFNTGSGISGAVICIEGVAHGDGLTEEDYASKLLDFYDSSTGKNRPKLTKGSSIYDTQFTSVNLRLHSPCHILHAGDCQHFFVVDQVRLHHLNDPPYSSFPLTTQITPPLLDLCRACSKAPAVWSIVGDIRLGESPFVMCAPCWRWMGTPKGDEVNNVTVVPLVKYEHGWGG